MHRKSGEKLNDKMHWLEHLAFAWHLHFCFPSTCTGFNSVPSLHCPVRRTSLPKGPTQHFTEEVTKTIGPNREIIKMIQDPLFRDPSTWLPAISVESTSWDFVNVDHTSTSNPILPYTSPSYSPLDPRAK